MTATRLGIILISGILTANTSTVHGQALPERGYAAVQVGYADFVDDFFSPESDGPHFGVRIYIRVREHLLVGTEVGAAANFTLFVGEEVTVTPIEVNAKYLWPLGDRVAAGVGAGLSMTRVNHQASTPLFGGTGEDDVAWLFGGQIVADVSVVLWRLVLGFDAKYHLTQDFPDESWNAGNWRVGPYLGVAF